MTDSERHVRALSEKHHLPWDRGMDNTVAAVARHAQAQGLSQIDHLAVKDGQIRYATHDGAFIKEGALAARQAANVPAEQSMGALAPLVGTGRPVCPRCLVRPCPTPPRSSHLWSPKCGPEDAGFRRGQGAKKNRISLRCAVLRSAG